MAALSRRGGRDLPACLGDELRRGEAAGGSAGLAAALRLRAPSVLDRVLLVGIGVDIPAAAAQAAQSGTAEARRQHRDAAHAMGIGVLVVMPEETDEAFAGDHSTHNSLLAVHHGDLLAARELHQCHHLVERCVALHLLQRREVLHYAGERLRYASQLCRNPKYVDALEDNVRGDAEFFFGMQVSHKDARDPVFLHYLQNVGYGRIQKNLGHVCEGSNSFCRCRPKDEVLIAIIIFRM